MVAARFPRVRLVPNDRNLGFGNAVNRGVAALRPIPTCVVLVNNDVVCEPEFVERMLAPFTDEHVGMVAGVLLQGSAPDLVDSAGIELDSTLRSYDSSGTHRPRRCRRPRSRRAVRGAAALPADRVPGRGGFDPAFFAYWEDVDLALRFRLAGWRCAGHPARAPSTGTAQTLGAGSPAQRRLDAFGRGVRARASYRVSSLGPLTRLRIALLDWPVLLVHLVVRRELGPIRARAHGARAGAAHGGLRAPVELATVGLAEALRRQYGLLLLRFTGGLPQHFRRASQATTTGTRAAPPSDPV